MSKMHIETTVDIAAPAQRVWQELTSFASYGEWSRFILSIRGEPRSGEKLTVKLSEGGRPITIRPIVIAADEGRELCWRGKLGSTKIFGGEHYFRLSSLPDGRTRFTHGENFTGLLARLMWKSLNTTTRGAFGKFNEALRTRAERPAVS